MSTVTTADALAVMAEIAACHPRTAPRVDDTQATLAIAATWARLFAAAGLGRGELVDAVHRRALSQAGAPEPAELIAVARATRQDRAMREPDAARRAREAAIDARAADAVAAIAARAGIPERTYTRPSRDGRITGRGVDCDNPPCRRRRGQPCFNSATGRDRDTCHPTRIDKEMALRAAEAAEAAEGHQEARK